ncbi:hypothetical protein ANOM_002278 [Aspergillus nomiae NRRL 13137]|uniref:Uncharacterized protein n=1 Tax=Aspergillus nomiae NRRL (strain ATCC 15546 / NRRL 13137 / CBS 260.88 / M93) TaxID=1509407 RepID=A0A0L1JCK2_ASPN3|nr:uncharacterized protein ANOM_002278 [Aspergillus nomiae NRRL 13137]KNG89476.1 hypothetical protein ANOM_002278 [Aspergillus nomiae NRRL 13137]
MPRGIPYRHIHSPGHAITKVHRESQEELQIVDRLLEPQTIVHFLECCHGAPLPNGKQSTLPKLTAEEIHSLSTHPDADPNGEPFLERVMKRIGSREDGDRLCIVGKNIHSAKSRAWEGIIPLSEQRWREKGLDHFANFQVACQYLSSVLAVFEYLNKPRVAQNLRDTFNLIYAHWEECDAVLNGQHRRLEQEPVSVAKRWTEFIAAHYEMMTERAHRWVISHVNTLRAPLLEGLLSHRPMDESIVDRVQWKMTDALHVLMEISAVADYTIMIPMHGYKGHTPSPIETGIPPGLRSPDYEKRGKEHQQRLKLVSRMIMFQNIRTTSRGVGEGMGSPESLHRTALQQIESQNKVRRETRGEPIEPVPREPWIAKSLARLEKSDKDPVGGFGLAIYRLTYKQNDTEWAGFLQKLETHVADWGRGQTGSNAIKPLLKLHWLDGKALGIPEGDIDAAKKHFNDHAISSFEDTDRVDNSTFLVIDDACVASYMGDSYSAATEFIPSGDHSGFVLAVDAHYDPKEGIERPDESPGYYGQMRILGNLIWGDLYAMLSSQSALLEDLWPLAINHPNGVYTGPTVPMQVKCWKVQNGMRSTLLRKIVEYVEAQMSGTASSSPPPPVPPRRSEQSARSEPDATLRAYLLRQFAQDMRRQGNIQHAVLAEEAIDLQPDEEPDWERIQRRLDAESETGNETRPNMRDRGGPDNQCAPQ